MQPYSLAVELSLIPRFNFAIYVHRPFCPCAYAQGLLCLIFLFRTAVLYSLSSVSSSPHDRRGSVPFMNQPVFNRSPRACSKQPASGKSPDSSQ